MCVFGVGVWAVVRPGQSGHGHVFNISMEIAKKIKSFLKIVGVAILGGFRALMLTRGKKFLTNR